MGAAQTYTQSLSLLQLQAAPLGDMLMPQQHIRSWPLLARGPKGTAAAACGPRGTAICTGSKAGDAQVRAFGNASYAKHVAYPEGTQLRKGPIADLCLKMQQALVKHLRG